MREYKMRRGETLAEPMPDLQASVESYFGPITETTEHQGSDLFVVGTPDNPVFERIVAGAVSYPGKKDTLAVEFIERDPAELSPTDLEAAGAAVAANNEFLLEATGRNAKSRRDSLKREMDKDAPEF